jgi:hypothetical protein
MNSVVFSALIVVGLLLATGVGVGIFHVRRRVPRPVELRPSPDNAAPAVRFPGLYLETRRLILDAESGRFTGWRLGGRSRGHLELSETGLRFRRSFWRRSVWLPYGAIRQVNVVFSPRRCIRDKMALELDWEAGGLRLRSIFVLDGGVSASVHAARWVEARL